MGTSGLISLGTRAMFANMAALQTTGQNIANANTAGYSRQTVELANTEGQYTGSGYMGKGVSVVTVTRSHNEFLTREAASTRSVAAMDQTRSAKLRELENVFGSGQSGLGFAVNEMLNSMVDIGSHPNDPSARQTTIARAAEAATRFSDAGAQLDALQIGVNMDLKTTVSAVNQLAARIAEANAKIASSGSLGHTPNDMLDLRDRLISEVSQYVRVSTILAPDGSMSVFIGGGQRLVLGGEAQPLALIQDEYDSLRFQLGMQDASGTRKLDESLLGGGSLAGLLQYQNQDLQQARNLVGQLATVFASEVNKQQSLGLDITTPGGSPGAPLFSVAQPRVLPAATNEKDPSGAWVSTLNLTISDATQLKASSYELVADPSGTPGSYQLTRLSDGLKRLIVDGDEVDGFTIAFTPPLPGPTDRFLLQPVTRAANGMALIMNNPNGLAAASPLTGTTGAQNTGTGTISLVAAVLPSTDPSVVPDIRTEIIFNSDTGNYDYYMYERSTGMMHSSGSGLWVPGQAIAINDFELKLIGVPKRDDTFTVDRTVLPSLNNGNALAFLAMRDKELVGRQLQSDGSVIGGANFTDAYASAMSDIGVRVQGSATRASISAGIATAVEKDRSSNSGVNLDEEAAKLLQFQQSYQAAAKVLQVAQNVFDTLMQVTGR